jgi:hypothetical protein
VDPSTPTDWFICKFFFFGGSFGDFLFGLQVVDMFSAQFTDNFVNETSMTNLSNSLLKGLSLPMNPFEGLNQPPSPRDPLDFPKAPGETQYRPKPSQLIARMPPDTPRSNHWLVGLFVFLVWLFGFLGLAFLGPYAGRTRGGMEIYISFIF